MAAVAKLEFWFDFASTYSYLSAVRLRAMEKTGEASVSWRPFLLGPVFKAQGWDNSPFNIYPLKGRYMWRDMARLTQARGLVFNPPDPFPQNSLTAARIGVLGEDEPWLAEYCVAVFEAEFGRGSSISDDQVLIGLLDGLKLDGAHVLERAQLDDNKHKLKERGARAAELGLFGAPSFIVGDELFRGDDRLDMALEWGRR
jgi:2-hydroxychromene-2-carboxylate isomerase